MTPIQRRTLDELVGPGRGRDFPAGLSDRLRARIEEAIGPLAPRASAIRLTKERLNDHSRCEGLFRSGLLGERPPFETSFRSASGTLLHKAIEIEAGGREHVDPWPLAERAAMSLHDERRFGPFWEALGPTAQDELLMETVRGVEMFRASFPPLRPLRSDLVPVTELWLEARFRAGAVVVSGCVDLVLNRPEPSRSTRLLLDLKSGGAWPEHPEDMRLYALLYTLRFGVPPIRVATVFLSSGEWQAEEVSEDTLVRAADRVVRAARAAAELAKGREERLTAGPYCSWCPRRSACPAARERVATPR